MSDKPKPRPATVTFKALKVDPAKYSILWRAHAGKNVPGPDDALADGDLRMACLVRLLADLKFVPPASYSLVIGQLADYIRTGAGDPRLTFLDRSAFSVAYGLANDPVEIIDLTTGRSVKVMPPVEELIYAFDRYCARCLEAEPAA